MDLNLDNPEQIKQLIMALQKLLPANEESETDEIDESTIKTKTVSMSKKSKRKNKFVDMPEKNMHKDDSAVDKILSKMPPVARSREFTPVQVKCRICGETEEVSPSLITSDSKNRYKCNKCSTSAG